MPYPVFFCERTIIAIKIYQRMIYHEKAQKDPACNCYQWTDSKGQKHWGTHYAVTGEIERVVNPKIHGHPASEEEKRDPRFPIKCDRCNYLFKSDDDYYVNMKTLYKRSDTGDEVLLHQLPIGACYDSNWYPEEAKAHPEWHWLGPDGRKLTVMTPDGEWDIDSRASNCTLPNDHVHRCWVRHGKPEDGTLHVDKNGATCRAGQGSIVMRNYHGFLQLGSKFSNWKQLGIDPNKGYFTD